jgi:ABC-type Zn uptake system ZnuABC Zn-binding protein ZnuA
MKKTKRYLLILTALASIFLAPLLTVGTAAAQASDQAACKGLGGTWKDGGCSVGDQPSIETTISVLISVMSAIAGIASVIMIIISGFRFITANGDPGSVAAARRTLMYALVGVVVVAASQSIVWFVLGGF